MKGRTPTKAERQWMDQICQLNCIVCRLHLGVLTPAMPHHIDGKTKPGAHFKTIPLCDGHHQNAPPGSGEVSRHPNKAEFERRYGSEAFLLQETRKLVHGVAA